MTLTATGKFRMLVMLLVIVGGSVYGQHESLKVFPLSSVKLTAGPFYQAQMTDTEYILALDPDRLLAPFQIDAGIQPKAERYGNWENTGLDGHIGGHYLSALSLMYAATKKDELLQRLNYMIDRLEECQRTNGNGYVGGIPGGQSAWKEVGEGKIDAGTFSLNGKWVPLYNIHKLYAGLRDAYILTENKKALDMLVKLSDWFLTLTAGLSDAQMQEILRSEHGGMNEIFADVAAITGNEKYLSLAKRMSHKIILDPLLAGKDQLTGLHANTQIPKVIGFKRVGEIAHDDKWNNAAAFFWETVVKNRSVSIGGNSVREHFHPADNFSSMMESNQGPETCNTYNMLRLTNLLFLSQPDVDYIDYYERALYNHILSSQHPEKGGFVYFTPMRPRHYRVYSQPHDNFWCCVGSGLENHGKYGELIYAHNDKDIYVNLFIPSTLTWKEKGIILHQQTSFPYNETSQLQLELKKSQEFTLNIRYPGWVRKGDMAIRVNGKVQTLTAGPGTFVSIQRKWKSGDKISITLPMHTRVEYLPDGSSWASFIHGPLVLAAVTDSTDLPGLWADGSRMGHVAGGKLYPVEEAPMIVKSNDDLVSAIRPVKEKSLTFTVSDVIYPERYKNVELVPFFTVHEARYMIYWPVTTPDELERRKQEIEEREREKLALEERTVDQVAPGEQQPETEHNLKGERTESGIHEGRFWRHAYEWFSYDLRNKDSLGEILRITYFGGDRGRTFDILLNDTLLKTVTLDGSQGSKFFDVDYIIPKEILDSVVTDETLTVKFVAKTGSMAGGVYYVRLLTE